MGVDKCELCELISHTVHMASRNPERRSVELLIRWLKTLGYQDHQIQEEYRLSDGSGRVDVAVFRDERHGDDNLILIAECKQMHGDKGLDQLRRYLDRCGASIGIWFNGIHLTYVTHWRNASRYLEGVENSEEAPSIVFGRYIRKRRKELQKVDRAHFTVRKVAGRLGMTPSYLSQIERGKTAPPSDDFILKLVEELDVCRHTLFAKAGTLDPKIRQFITLRPREAVALLDALVDAPNEVLEKVARRVKDGNW